jgi:hypothetical protein
MTRTWLLPRRISKHAELISPSTDSGLSTTFWLLKFREPLDVLYEQRAPLGLIDR